MTTTSDKIRIEVELDTSSAEQGAKRLKNSLNNVGDAAGNISSATGTTVVAFEDLENSMNALIGLNFAEAFGKPVYDAISNIGKVITESTECMRKFKKEQAIQIKQSAANYRGQMIADGIPFTESLRM
jgi:hypothetical protein